MNQQHFRRKQLIYVVSNKNASKTTPQKQLEDSLRVVRMTTPIGGWSDQSTLFRPLQLIWTLNIHKKRPALYTIIFCFFSAPPES